MARAIVKSETQDDRLTDDIFIAGLMHDIGKLILGYVMEEEYGEIYSGVQGIKPPAVDSRSRAVRF